MKLLAEMNVYSGSKGEISESSAVSPKEPVSTFTEDIKRNDQECSGNSSDAVLSTDNAAAVTTPSNVTNVQTFTSANTSLSTAVTAMQKSLNDNTSINLDVTQLIDQECKSSMSGDISESEDIVQIENETSSKCGIEKASTAGLVTVAGTAEAEGDKFVNNAISDLTTEESAPIAMTSCSPTNLSETDILNNLSQLSGISIETADQHASTKTQIATSSTETEEDSGLETAIECETTVIATIHDLSQESDFMRLTESELQLGKSKPYWIPDVDCAMCMLCNSKFSLLNRRHHCRACGRVACGTCCKERAMLEYMKDEPKKQARARVCTPCASMLARIENYEKSIKEHADRNTAADTSPSTSTGNRMSRGVLKMRTSCVTEIETENLSSPDTTEKKRSVVFRDGVKPGATTSINGVDIDMEEKNTTLKPKKKSRKRQAITRRVAELRMEEELRCALPTPFRQKFLVVNSNGEMEMVDEEFLSAKLEEELPITIVLKKNLTCVVRICKVDSMSVFCVHSCGFVSIGLDELLFVWQRDDISDFSVPLNVLQRIGQVNDDYLNEDAYILFISHQIFSTSCDADQAGVRQVCSRLPAIHSVPIALPPLPRHILFFPPTLQDFSNLSVPNSPFLIALFLHDTEISWAMACPNRLLLRLGLKYSCKYHFLVFTDFNSWSFRIKHLEGCTVTLTNDITLVEIPRCAKNDLNEIISLNGTMLAWTTSMNLSADSHLVCDEINGFYSTQVFARGSSRKATGTSFIIIDGGLKNSGIQISVIEDGVTIRIPSMKLKSLLTSLENMQDWSTCDSSGAQFSVHWTDTNIQSSHYGPNSQIDGINLSNKYQYGLSLERAISSVLQVSTVSDYGVRLSHVYNLKEGRLSPDDEPKVFSVAEMLARECTGMLEPYLPLLINMNIMATSIRVSVSAEKVEYDVSPWCGMEEQNMLYKQNMDQLIPVLCDILRYLSDGFHIEFTLSFVITKSLPYII
ncbi:FYVE zinc finger [Dictyocaulus viviparus]|uniref:FYVE zinc finger n=1 Tax=Dictyocaulus viviparus TaxID=29172 RepID=A0A0D8XFK2_DICVI|nr:FYVE zinc finger [Dictyocaulus viviparus]